MTDAANCPYHALGLTKEATTAEIKKAFRKLALEFHPDKVQGEEAKEAASKKFQKVNEAYGILSDEEKRQEYDDKVKLMELRKRSKGEANISVPRTPTATHYDVRYAEPRSDTYRAKSSSRAPPPPTTKIYSQYPPSASRSYEEDIYAAARHYEDVSRSARRSQPYEEKQSKREEELRDRDRRRRMEDREEKERLMRAADKKEKERLRAEKELKQKKQRKKETEEKRSHREASYAVYDDEEPIRSSKSDKKKSSSSSKKHETRERERSTPREIARDESGVSDKSAQFMMAAAQYINASRSKAPNPPSLSRSNTFQDQYSDRYAQIPPVAVPTPPTAQEAPFAPPVSVEEATDEDRPLRSSAKPSARRSSDTPKSREKSSHKKSSSGPKEYTDATPIIIDPASRHVPAFAKAGSTPPRVPDSPPHHHKLSRAHTMKEEAARAPPAQPSLSRSSTYHYPGEYTGRETREPRGRDRSRLQPQVLSEEEDSEDERRYESSRRTDRRHRTRSPEVVPMPADYPPARGGSAYRYHVKEGRTIPIQAPMDPYYHPEDASPPSRKSKSATYYQPYEMRTAEVRPPMPSRDSAYSSSGGYIPGKIKTQQAYSPSDVQYSYREPATGWA